MKKLLMVLLLLVGFTTLVACDNSDTSDTTTDTSDTSGNDSSLTSIEIAFPETGTKEITQDSQFDVTDGVTAYGDDMVNYKSKMTVTSSVCNITNNILDTSVPTTCVLTYSVSSGDVSATADRTVVINEKASTGDNLLTYSTFDSAYTGWGQYIESNDSTFTVDGDKAVVNVVNCPSSSYQVRLDTSSQPITLVAGQNYEITFKASATVSRNILVQMGQMVSYDPWFYQVTPEAYTVALTSDYTTKSILFTAQSAGDMSQVALTIEMGAVNSAAIDSVITIGEVSVHTYGGDLDDSSAPTVTAVDKTFYLNDQTTYTTAMLASYVVASDNVSSSSELVTTVTNITDMNNATATITEIDGTTAGSYKVSVTVTDAAGNATNATFYVTVREKTAEPADGNYFGTMDTTIGSGGEADSKANTGKTFFWYDTSIISGTCDGSTITANYEVWESTNWYSPQIFYTTAPIDYDGTYTFSVDVTCTESRVIQVNGQVITLVAGVTQTVTVSGNAITAGQSFTMSIQLNESGALVVGSGTLTLANLSLTK